MDSWIFYSISYNPILTSIILLLRLSRFSHWEFLELGCEVHFEHVLIFWYYRMLWAHVVFSSALGLLQRALVLFIGEYMSWLQNIENEFKHLKNIVEAHLVPLFHPVTSDTGGQSTTKQET